MASLDDQLSVLAALGGKDGPKYAQAFKDRDATLRHLRKKIPERAILSARGATTILRMLLRTSSSFCRQLPVFVQTLERKYAEMQKENPVKYPLRKSVEQCIREAMEQLYWVCDPELSTRVAGPCQVSQTINGVWKQVEVPGIYEGREWDAWRDRIQEMDTQLGAIADYVYDLGWHFPRELGEFMDSFGPNAKKLSYGLGTPACDIYDIQLRQEAPSALAGSESSEEGATGTVVSLEGKTTQLQADQSRAMAKRIAEMSTELATMRKSIESMEHAFKKAPQDYETVLGFVTIKKSADQLTALVEAMNRA